MPEQKRYEWIIQVEEDLHSGTGTGGKGLDAVQLTGRDGLPMLRATHLKGLLRDAAEELKSLGHADDNAIHALFGEPGQQRGTLILQSLRSDGKADWDVRWQSTARKPDSRVPEDDTLRAAQYVKAGSEFRGEFCVWDDKENALLKDCLRRVTHIGSNRTRDGGRVTIRCNPIDCKGRKLAKPGQHTRLRLVLKNLDPLNLPTTGFPGNIIATECYIRGQQLLGALAAWALARGKQADAEWLLKRDVRIGNAYPVSEKSPDNAEKWEVMPFPLHIYTPKPQPGKDTKLPWWVQRAPGKALLGAKQEINHYLSSSDSEEKPKRPGDREFLFRVNSVSDWIRYKPSVGVHLRNQTYAKNKKTAELFAEEEIAEDTLFVADIECAGQAQAFYDKFQEVLEGRAWLAMGRGGRPVEVLAAHWLPAPERAKKPDGRLEKLTLTLTSDLIARSLENLGFYDTLDPCVLAELAGIAKTDLDEDLDWKAVCDTVTVRGFNALTGLPRAPALAIRRGSSICLTTKQGDLSKLWNKLNGLPISALGERTWEGFGCFTLTETTWKESQAKPAEKAKIQTSERVMQDVLDLVDILEKKNIKGTKTQWQMLGDMVRGKVAENKSDYITRLEQFKADADKRSSGEFWKKEIGNHKLIDKIIHTAKSYSAPADIQLFIETLARDRVLSLKHAEEKGHD